MIVFEPAWPWRLHNSLVVMMLLITAICICICSLLIYRKCPPYDHHLDVAKMVLWPRCTFLNNHVISSMKPIKLSLLISVYFHKSFLHRMCMCWGVCLLPFTCLGHGKTSFWTSEQSFLYINILQSLQESFGVRNDLFRQFKMLPNTNKC